MDFILKEIKGTGITLGLTDGTNNYGFQAGSDGQNRYVLSTGMYGQQVGSGSNVGDVPTGSAHYGITTDSTKSGIESEINSDIKYIIKY